MSQYKNVLIETYSSTGSKGQDPFSFFETPTVRCTSFTLKQFPPPPGNAVSTLHTLKTPLKTIFLHPPPRIAKIHPQSTRYMNVGVMKDYSCDLQQIFFLSVQNVHLRQNLSLHVFHNTKCMVSEPFVFCAAFLHFWLYLPLCTRRKSKNSFFSRHDSRQPWQVRIKAQVWTHCRFIIPNA